MSNSVNSKPDRPDNAPEDDPSWGGVIVGLMLATAGIGLIYNRYQQFHDLANDPISLTRIELLIYKIAGGNEWVLLAAYGIIALVGIYLIISNIIHLRIKQ
ncbi:MAG: hypothetical protein JO154_11525 [Chitinophaga sp.]|uniref:hypothetical protein n=1 Tax=Chitinophaga sp. TaxID=1869181 RepID=UPI0025BCB998|nr:hypothetical protein [Chitinophaga sp.]MBV8253227.1 hypothetical protein [Chitinophaga sp.]